jgi:hypothetical protein
VSLIFKESEELEHATAMRLGEELLENPEMLQDEEDFDDEDYDTDEDDDENENEESPLVIFNDNGLSDFPNNRANSHKNTGNP